VRLIQIAENNQKKYNWTPLQNKGVDDRRNGELEGILQFMNIRGLEKINFKSKINFLKINHEDLHKIYSFHT
jgi:hypothetical protein